MLSTLSERCRIIQIDKSSEIGDIDRWRSLGVRAVDIQYFITSSFPKTKNVRVITADSRPWTCSELGLYLKQVSDRSFNKDAQYPGDRSRFHLLQRRIASLGRFHDSAILASFVHRAAPFTTLGGGMVAAQKTLPFLRPRIHFAKITLNSDIPFMVIADSTGEKDHYGDNPLIHLRKSWLFDFLKETLSARLVPIVLFGVGPCHKYIPALHDWASANLRKGQSVFVFAVGMYRPIDRECVSKYSLSFSKGSNQNINGSPIYSPHCLSLGAGECELAFGKFVAPEIE
jgi:hypothetical protein